MAFFGPWVGEIDVETVHRIIWYKIGQKLCGVGADYPHVAQTPSTNAVDGIAVVFIGPFDAEEINLRVGLGVVEQEGCSAGADFDVHGAWSPENPEKIDFAIQIFGV